MRGIVLCSCYRLVVGGLSFGLVLLRGGMQGYFVLVLSCNVTTFATMSKEQTIDLSGYITQAEYCRINKMPLNRLSQWISRMKKGDNVPDEAKKIEFIYVSELNMTLVKK